MATSAPPKSFISDLGPSRVATVEATVTSLDSIREVEQRSGRKTRVRNLLLYDGTSQIELLLWGRDVALVTVGEEHRVVDGWVKYHRGNPESSLSR